MSDFWIPLDKNFKKLLPKNRPYTKLEAAFCLQSDANDNNSVSIAGYAKLWDWGIKKVRLFLEKMGVTIIYPSDTKQIQNQKGYLKKIIFTLGTDLGTDQEQIKEQISFIDINYLKEKRNRSGNRSRNRSGAATINPKILNPKEENTLIDPTGSTTKIVKDKDTFVTDVIGYLNSKAVKNFKPDTTQAIKLIKARQKEGYFFADFKKVIDNKCADWLVDPDRNKYLRPETLFGNKFDSYLNETINHKTNDVEDDEIEQNKKLLRAQDELFNKLRTK